jgi:hypothetical protein
VQVPLCSVPSLSSLTRLSVKARATHIFKATRTHALNLAKFVTIYKSLVLLQRKLNAGKERSADTFIAGLIGGYIVFGDRTAINEQVLSPLSYRSIVHVLMSHKCNIDRTLRGLPGRSIFHSSGFPYARPEKAQRPKPSNSSTSITLHSICGSHMGCSDVALQTSRRDAPTRHVELDEIPLPRFGPLELSEDSAVA